MNAQNIVLYFIAPNVVCANKFNSINSEQFYDHVQNIKLGIRDKSGNQKIVTKIALITDYDENQRYRKMQVYVMAHGR